MTTRAVPGAEGEAEAGSGVLLAEKTGFRLFRQGRFLAARLVAPHLCLTTSQVNGGEQQHLRYLLNHQSCEGKGHMGRHHDLAASSREEYHRAVCADAGLPGEATALMGTAANMQNAALAGRSFEEVEVTAVVTAGVQGNAGRAGDEAKWHEGRDAWKPLHTLGGTINTMVLFNWPLLPGALSRAVATMTEAKTAVLQELSVSSRYSPRLATGTGTDQFCLAAPLDASLRPKTWTGKHGKLGEILALAVMDATREALRWQNGLEPSRTRNLAHALGRFGVTEEALRAAVVERLSRLETQASAGNGAGGSVGDLTRLLNDNFLGVLHEPQAAAAGYALAAVMERIAFGALPPAAAAEMLLNQAALMASALAAQPQAFSRFREELSRKSAAEFLSAAEAARGAGPDLLPVAAEALAMGWAAKWA